MSTVTNIYQIPPIDIGSGNYIHVIHIECISSEMAELINEKIRLITEGNTTTDIAKVKKRLYKYLQRKKGTTLEMGAVAEFMIHLYLNENGFKQEFLFYNLEERSIKKGFDGYYSLDGEEWVLESKSGNISSPSNSHISKVSEAYNDLKSKVTDVDGNNPWRNAYNHACHIDVNSTEDIIKNLKKLAEDFESGIYKKIDNLNIIPASTLFLEGNWEEIDVDSLERELRNAFSNKRFKGLNLICINKKSINLLEDFLTS